MRRRRVAAKIVHGELVPARPRVQRHAAAHEPESDEADLHGRPPSPYFVTTTRSHSSPYCCLYGGQIFSSAIFRNEATSAAFTFIPRASRISLALATLSTLSVSSRTFFCASRPTSMNSFCCSGVRLFHTFRFITSSVGP